MAKIVISLCAVILGCSLLVHAEPPVNSYSINGDNNGYEYNNVMNGALMVGKDGHRENADFYSAGNNRPALTNARSQGNLEESLRSSSFNGFSPSSHNAFQGYSGTARDSLATNSYFLNDPAQSSFEGFTNSNNNADSTLESYASSNDQAGTNFNQFSDNLHKNTGYMGFADNMPGSSNTGGYPEIAPEGSSFREYSGDSIRSHVTGGYMDGDQAVNLFNGPNNEYSYGKHKNGMPTMGNNIKYTNDVYSLHPDTRYVRGNHGSMGRDYGSPMYSSSGPFSSTRTGLYGSGKFSKYNKFLGDYASNGGLNYLSKDQEADYVLGSNYSKGSGKIVSFKDSRPSSSNSQGYGPSYLSKIVGSYKSKPSFMNYPSSSHTGYSSMSNLHNYGDSSALRRYRSSSGYVPGHSSTYFGYY